MADDKNVELQIRAKNLTQQAFDAVSKALKALEDQSEQTTSKGTTSWGKWFSTITGGVAVGNLLSDAFKTVGGLLAQIPAQLAELAQRGSDLANVRQAFEGLTKSVGATADAILGRLRSAFGGTVSDFELMKSANDVLRRGVRLTGEDFAVLAQGSRILADQVGGNAKEAFDRMLSAIGRGNERELKDLGVNLSNIERTVKAHAAALGLEASELSQSQRQMALRNAVLQESKRLVTENGEALNGLGDNLLAINTLYDNWIDNIAEAIATSPALNSALGDLAQGLQDVFGGDRAQQVKTLSGWVDTVTVATLGLLRETLSAGVGITRTWANVQLVIVSSAAAIVGILEQVAKVNAAVASSAAAIPLAGVRWKEQAQDARDLALTLGIAQRTLDQQAKSAFDAATGNNVLEHTLKTVDAALARVTARAREAANTPIVPGGSKPGGGLGDLQDGLGLAGKQLEQFQKQLRAMVADADRAAKNNVLETWALANASAIEKMALQAASFGKHLNGNLLKAFIVGQLADAHKAAAKIAEDFAKQDIDRAEKIQKHKNDLILQGLKVAGDAIAEANDAAVHGTERELAILRRKRDEQLRLLEPLKTAMPEVYQQAVDAIEREFQRASLAAKNAVQQTVAYFADSAFEQWWEKWLRDIHLISGALRELAGHSDDAFSRVIRHVAVTVEAVERARAASIQMNVALQRGAAGWAQFAAGALQAAAAVKTATDEGSKAQRAFSGAVSGAAAGSAFGPYGAAIGAIAGALIGLFRGLTDYQKRVRAAAAETAAMKHEALETAGSLLNLRDAWLLLGMEPSFMEGFSENADPEYLRELLGELAERTGAFNDEINELLLSTQGLGFQAPAALRPYLDHLLEMNILTKENADLLRGFVAGGTIDFKKMEEAAGRYGISLDALGSNFWSAKLHANIEQILNDLDLFERGGADMHAVLAGMGDEIGEVVRRALVMGTSLPANLEPYIRRLLESGQLVDALGNKITDISGLTFGDPIKVGLDAIVDRLDKMLARMGAIPAVLDKIPKKVDVEVNVRTKGLVRGSGDVNPDDLIDPDAEKDDYELHDPDGNNSYARGTPNYDYQRFSQRGTPALLHGEEAVIPRAGVGQFASDVAGLVAAELAGSGARGDQPIVVHVHITNEIDGRVAAERIVTGLERNGAAFGRLQGMLRS